MKVTDYIARFLHERHVSCVFEMSGGMITHLLDSIERHGQIRIVSMHHEQGAAFAADGIARMNGIPGVAMATSGPGATNLLTGIGSCYFDSTPSVFITGQVNRSEQKGDRPVRQLGFQETDIVAMARPIVKEAWLVQTPEEIPELLVKAFDLAVSGRPGPVLIDIPMDVQRGDIAVPDEAIPVKTIEFPPISDAVWSGMFSQVREARRPLILAGGGVQSAHAVELLREFAHATDIPVVHSLMAVDVLPYSDPLNAGMLGSYGNRWSNIAIGQADLLLVLGSRLDIRQTGSLTDAFKGDRVIYHVDCDSGEINNRVTGCQAITIDLRAFLTQALEKIKTHEFPKRTEWLAEIDAVRQEWPDTQEATGITGINPNVLMHRVSQASTQAAAFVIDVGQHQMWAAQSLELGPDQRFLTSGGMGSMGFALPAAIGAAFASAPRGVVVIAGDGGFQSNIQELQTVIRNGLPIKIVVVNNGCHGMVRQFQQSYFDSRYQSTMWGYSAPDFTAVATAYGIASLTVSDDAQLDEALQWLWSDPTAPALLQVMIDSEANAYPKIAFGKPMTEMEPFATPLDMEGT